jgi:putative tryptophan/tyrosine transport system substrate-binding protein
MVGRREFIAGLGGAAVWPLAARAQQARPVIGYLGSMAGADVNRLRAFRQGLGEAGFAEGRNVTIEYRETSAGDPRLPELAADLIRRHVSVIVAIPPVAARVKAVTSTIPIVFWGVVDPVQVGLVASLNRPGANVTGVISMGSEIGGKQLSLMHELLPSAVRYALLGNPDGLVIGGPMAEEMQSLAGRLGGQMEVLEAATIGEIDNTFASLAQKRTEALFVAPGTFFANRRVQFATLATRYAIPTIYPFREFVEVGGLMSYGASMTDMQRQVGLYAGRVLMGVKPADLPVLRPTKFELVINAGTAKALGLAIPPTLLAIADEVID